MSRLTLPRKRVAQLPRNGSDNANDNVHEHPTGWPDVISVEPYVPHPSDPVEVTTEPRMAHPERPRARNRCPALRPRLRRSPLVRAAR